MEIKNLIKEIAIVFVLANNLTLHAMGAGGSKEIVSYNPTSNFKNSVEWNNALDKMDIGTSVDFIKALEAGGPSILSEQDEMGYTLSHYAAELGDISATVSLVIHNAPLLRDKNGKFPCDLTENKKINKIFQNGWLGCLPNGIDGEIFKYLWPEELVAMKNASSCFDWKVDCYCRNYGLPPYRASIGKINIDCEDDTSGLVLYRIYVNGKLSEVSVPKGSSLGAIRIEVQRQLGLIGNFNLTDGSGQILDDSTPEDLFEYEYNLNAI